MVDFFTRLAAQTLGLNGIVKPLPGSRFDPHHLEWEDDSFWTDSSFTAKPLPEPEQGNLPVDVPVHNEQPANFIEPFVPGATVEPISSKTELADLSAKNVSAADTIQAMAANEVSESSPTHPTALSIPPNQSVYSPDFPISYSRQAQLSDEIAVSPAYDHSTSDLLDATGMTTEESVSSAVAPLPDVRFLQKGLEPNTLGNIGDIDSASVDGLASPAEQNLLASYAVPLNADEAQRSHPLATQHETDTVSLETPTEISAPRSPIRTTATPPHESRVLKGRSVELGARSLQKSERVSASQPASRTPDQDSQGFVPPQRHQPVIRAVTPRSNLHGEVETGHPAIHQAQDQVSVSQSEENLEEESPARSPRASRVLKGRTVAPRMRARQKSERVSASQPASRTPNQDGQGFVPPKRHQPVIRDVTPLTNLHGETETAYPDTHQAQERVSVSQSEEISEESPSRSLRTSRVLGGRIVTPKAKSRQKSERVSASQSAFRTPDQDGQGFVPPKRPQPAIRDVTPLINLHGETETGYPAIHQAQDQVSVSQSGENPEILLPPQVAIHSAASNTSEPNPAPTIRISIGRIEVKSPSPSPPPSRPARPSPNAPSVSLDDYLKQRNGGNR